MQVSLILAEYVSEAGLPHFFTMVHGGIRMVRLHPTNPPIVLHLLAWITTEESDVRDVEQLVEVAIYDDRLQRIGIIGRIYITPGGAPDSTAHRFVMDQVLSAGRYQIAAFLGGTEEKYRLPFVVVVDPLDETADAPPKT